jgi:hypothetical protein
MFRDFLICCCSILMASSAMCAEFVQPDGSVVELRPIEADSTVFFEDSKGFSVVHIPAEYQYALPGKDGGLEPSGIEIGRVDPKKSALPLNLRPEEEFLRRQRASGLQGYAPRSPNPIEVKLRDGSILRLRMMGGGSFTWYEDEDSYAVVSTAGRYEYALRNSQGVLVPTGILAGSMNPDDAGLKPGIRPAPRGPQ